MASISRISRVMHLIQALQHRATGVLAASALSFAHLAAQAIVHDLSADWSDITNPNGPWTYGDSAGPITVHPGNYGTGVGFPAGQGAWAYASGGTGIIASWFKTTSQVGPIAGLEYLPGDVISGPWDANVGQPGHGPSSVLTWTSPSEGTIDVSGFTWNAHVGGGQAIDWALGVRGVPLASGVLGLNAVDGRSHPTYFSVLGMGVKAGDPVTFTFTPHDLYANWAGLSLTITAVPEPTSLAAAGALSVMAWVHMARRRRKPPAVHQDLTQVSPPDSCPSP